MMIGQADSLIRFDENVLRLVSRRHQQIQTNHRDIQCTGRADGSMI